MPDLRCVCLLAVCSTSLGLVLTQREQHSQTPPLEIWETINSRRENFLHHNVRRYSSSWILDDGVELPAFVTVQGDPRVHQKVKVKVTTPTQVHHLHLKKLESILHPDVKIVSITGHSNGKPDFIVEDIEPLVRERSQHFFHNPETGTVVSLWKHAAGHYLIEGHLDHATVIEPPGSRSRHTRDTDKKSHSVYRSVDGHEDIGSVGPVSPDESSGYEIEKSFASLLLKYALNPKSNGPATDKSISKEDQNRASLRERLKNVLEKQSDFSAFPGIRHHEFLASDDGDHDDDFVEVPAVFENKSKWKVEKGRAERTSVDDDDKTPTKDQMMKHWTDLSTKTWAYEEARNRSHKFDRHHPRAKRQVATDWTSSLMPGYLLGDAGKTVVRKDGNYVVEVMTMVDARTYEDFNYDWMALQIYLLHFWQGVNARFQDIGDPKVRLKVKSINKVVFSGYQPFIENNRIDNSTGRVDVNGLLTDFMTYISNHYESNPALPDHDIAILLTGEDLCKKKADGTWSQKSKGIAFVRGGCISSRRFLNQSYDVGVVEVGRGFRGILTAAHEVGHLLGAFHDGEKNSSSCSSSSGHLMSHVWADPYLYNRFSNCSRQNFKHFMENTWYSECLLSSDSNYTTGYEFPPHWAGEAYSLEEQCHQYIEGIPCAGVSLESQCGQLCCEKWTQQFPSKEPAVDGTFCGVGKMCYNGECVTKRVGQ